MRLSRNKKLKNKDYICVSFIYKKYRRLIYLHQDTSQKRQKFLLEREYKNMIGDINSPSIRDQYNLDE